MQHSPIRKNKMEEELTKFYQDLSEKQTPLSEEFEQVIVEHLWDLYIDN
jgi:hypothetical protein